MADLVERFLKKFPQEKQVAEGHSEPPPHQTVSNNKGHLCDICDKFKASVKPYKRRLVCRPCREYAETHSGEPSPRMAERDAEYLDALKKTYKR